MLVARRIMRITTLLFVLVLARAAQAQSILGGSGTGSGGGLGNGLLDALPGVAGLLNTDPVERPRDIETIRKKLSLPPAPPQKPWWDGMWGNGTAK